jgi:16S rRNA (cytosine1402-N4)-methyltransferase
MATTAADLVNSLDEQALVTLFREYGEEPQARRMARAIVEARRKGRLTSTTELARLAERAIGRHGKLHPATRVFQALRIAVNAELDALAEALPQAVSLLRPGGRLAVIAFHSLEDRLVKRFLQQEMMTCVCPSTQLVCTCGHHPTLRAISKGAIKAEPDEVRHNRRARSARLRVAERL